MRLVGRHCGAAFLLTRLTDLTRKPSIFWSNLIFNGLKPVSNQMNPVKNRI
jgi:hypothetical protein